MCERHGYSYQKMKEDCDEYFTITHRGETRGVSAWPRGCHHACWLETLAKLSWPGSLGGRTMPHHVPALAASSPQLGGIIYEDLNDR